MPFPALRRDRAPQPLAVAPVFQPKALTAAGEAYDATFDIRKIMHLRGSPALAWQYQALVDYRRCGLVHFGTDFVSTMLSRIVYYPANIDPQTGDATPIDSGPLVDAMDMLQSRIEGRSSLLGRAAGLDYLCGESWLVMDDDQFEVLSVTEFSAQGDRLLRVRFPGAPKEEFRPQFIARLWRPDFEYYWLADSPHRAVMGDVDRLVRLGDSITAVAQSRISARGAWLYPSEANDSRRPTLDKDGNTIPPTTVGQDFIEVASKAALDPSSAAATVPIPIGVPGEMADKSRFVDFGTKQDARIIELREEAKRSYSEGVNLPLERLMGKGDMNHWNYGGVTADEVRHLQSPAQFLCDAIARAYLRPIAAKLGLDPSTVGVGFDDGPIVIPPDQSQVAAILYDKSELSGEAWRRLSNVAEDDAPGDDERRRRLLETIVTGGGVQAIIRDAANELGLGLPDNPSPFPAQDGSGDVNADNPSPFPAQDGSQAVTPEAEPEAVAASIVAAAPRPLAQLGRRLHSVDVTTRDTIAEMCDMALTSALRRAGTKMLSAMRGQSKAYASVPLEEVVARVGNVRQFGQSEDALVAGAFADLAARVERKLSAAQRKARLAVADEGEFDEDGYEQRAGEATASAIAALSVLMTALAMSRLYDPHPAAPERGELGATSVPSTLVDLVLAVAGGREWGMAHGQPELAEVVGLRPVTGVASGPLALGALSEAVAPQTWAESYTWVWGGSERAFEPHLSLSGVEWTTDDLSPLVNLDGWPDVPFFYAGDHVGCSCSEEPTFVLVEAAPGSLDVGMAASGNGRVVA